MRGPQTKSGAPDLCDSLTKLQKSRVCRKASLRLLLRSRTGSLALERAGEGDALLLLAQIESGVQQPNDGPGSNRPHLPASTEAVR
jgi:hypothetical protein